MRRGRPGHEAQAEAERQQDRAGKRGQRRGEAGPWQSRAALWGGCALHRRLGGLSGCTAGAGRATASAGPAAASSSGFALRAAALRSLLCAGERILVLLVAGALRERGRWSGEREQQKHGQKRASAGHAAQCSASDGDRRLGGVEEGGKGTPARRVALVHDFLVSVRGAERVFLAMCDLWPDADLFTPIYDEEGTEGRFAHRNVNTSFLQRLRPGARNFRTLLPLYPAAIESFDLSGYDLVISSSSAWAHAVVCEERTVHVCYCHNPFRYAWNERHRTLSERGDPISRAALRSFFRRWREWDWIAAQRVDRYVTNSGTTQARIEAYFGRASSVVYPPVETHRFTPTEPGEHYLLLSELVSHKRIDVAVEAFTRLGLPLVVVGDGPDRRRLRRMAGPTVRFAGRVTDGDAARLLATCRAFVVTAVEEFGIAAVEAQAAGRPVIARHGGGVLETVVEGVTGCLWSGGADELAEAVRSFDPDAVDSRECVENAARFDSAVFRRSLPREVDEALAAAGEGPQIHPRGGRRAPISRRPFRPAPLRSRGA